MLGGEPAADRAALTAEGEVDGGNSAAHGASGRGSGGDSRRPRQMQRATVAEVARRGRGEGSARASWRGQPTAETEATAATRTGEAEPTGEGAELSVPGRLEPAAAWRRRPAAKAEEHRRGTMWRFTTAAQRRHYDIGIRQFQGEPCQWLLPAPWRQEAKAVEVAGPARVSGSTAVCLTAKARPAQSQC